MSAAQSVFLYVTGAGSCTRVPDIIRGLLAHDFTVYSVPTPNVSLVSPPASILDLPGNHWIHHYRQDPLDRFPFGIMLVAPCTFNTFNKLALGIADNLATAMIADGLGAGCPVIIAPSMNRGLWDHPQTAISLERLRSWGCEVIPPSSDKWGSMAPNEEVINTVLRVYRAGAAA